MRSPLLLSLLGVAGLLGAILLLEFAEPAAPAAEHRVAALTAASANAASKLAAAPENLPRLVDATLARPLFEPSRRPPSSAPAATEAPGTTSLPRLAGIIITPTRRSVIFANPTTDKPLVLAEGDKVDGYLIQSISPDQVVVISRDSLHVLRPTFDAGAPKAASKAALAGPAPNAAAAADPASTGRPILPGLKGRPLGLAPSADDAAQLANTFPSIAAPAPQTPSTAAR